MDNLGAHSALYFHKNGIKSIALYGPAIYRNVIAHGYMGFNIDKKYKKICIDILQIRLIFIKLFFNKLYQNVSYFLRKLHLTILFTVPIWSVPNCTILSTYNKLYQTVTQKLPKFMCSKQYHFHVPNRSLTRKVVLLWYGLLRFDSWTHITHYTSHTKTWGTNTQLLFLIRL